MLERWGCVNLPRQKRSSELSCHWFRTCTRMSIHQSCGSSDVQHEGFRAEGRRFCSMQLDSSRLACRGLLMCYFSLYERYFRACAGGQPICTAVLHRVTFVPALSAPVLHRSVHNDPLGRCSRRKAWLWLHGSKSEGSSLKQLDYDMFP